MMIPREDQNLWECLCVLGCVLESKLVFVQKESFSPHIYVVLEIRISTNCDCGQKNVKRQFFAIFESGNLNIHSNTDSNILFFAIFEYGKIVFRNSITLPVSYFPIPTAEMIVNIWNLPPELKIKGVRLKSDWYKLFINLTLLGHVTENFNF